MQQLCHELLARPATSKAIILTFLLTIKLSMPSSSLQVASGSPLSWLRMVDFPDPVSPTISILMRGSGSSYYFCLASLHPIIMKSIKSILFLLMSMKDRVAVVTASSTGIGKAIVERLGQEGCKVVVSSRNKKNIDEAVQELKKKGIDAIGIVCHVGKKEDRANLLKETFNKFGRIDYLVGNAAVSTHMGDFFEASQDQIKKMWDINYLSTFFLVRQALPYLRKQPGSSIVILSSYAGYEGSNMIGHYALTKTALLGLTKTIAKQLVQDQIRVNGVAPGLIKTQFSGQLWKNGEKQAADVMGVKRLGEPRDIANVVKFLLSDQAAYLTGQNILVAGRPVSRL